MKKCNDTEIDEHRDDDEDDINPGQTANADDVLEDQEEDPVQ